MDALPGLLHQDRAEFERALSRTLAEPSVRTAIGRVDGLRVEEIRARARRAADELMAAAAPEFDEYARLRAARELARSLGDPKAGAPQVRRPGRERLGDGGLLGAAAVLTPVLSGAAAVIFFLLAFVLDFDDSQRRLAASVVEAAWSAAIIAAASALAGLTGLLIAASRQRTHPVPADAPAVVPATVVGDLERAREAWRDALVERGLRPFVLALAAESRPGAPSAPRPRTASEAPPAPRSSTRTDLTRTDLPMS